MIPDFAVYVLAVATVVVVAELTLARRRAAAAAAEADANANTNGGDPAAAAPPAHDDDWIRLGGGDYGLLPQVLQQPLAAGAAMLAANEQARPLAARLRLFLGAASWILVPFAIAAVVDVINSEVRAEL